MRSIMRTLGIGAASTALVLAAPAVAQAHGGHHDDNDKDVDTTIDEINDPGYIIRGGDAALVKVEYTCPEDSEAKLRVWLEQEQDDDKDHGHHGGGGHHGDNDDGHQGGGVPSRHRSSDTVTGSRTVYDLDCTDESEKVYVKIWADDDEEWEKGDAEAKALIVSKKDRHHHDDDWDHGRRHGSKYDKDFDREDIELKKFRHHR